MRTGRRQSRGKRQEIENASGRASKVKDVRRLARFTKLVERQFAEKPWRRSRKWTNEPMEPLFELKVTIPAAGSREIASQLFRQLKDAILDKRLRPGSRLPSTRDAQRLFGVSRNTVQDVYDRLAQEGLALARHGSGTFVREARSDPTPRRTASDDERHGRVNPFWERPDIASWIG